VRCVSVLLAAIERAATVYTVGRLGQGYSVTYAQSISAVGTVALCNVPCMGDMRVKRMSYAVDRQRI